MVYTRSVHPQCSDLAGPEMGLTDTVLFVCGATWQKKVWSRSKMKVIDPTNQPLSERLLLIEREIGRLSDFCERINGRIMFLRDEMYEMFEEGK